MSDLKIVQAMPLPNDATYQGALWGLRSDGVICEYVRGAWNPIVPNKFTHEDDGSNKETKVRLAFLKVKEIAIQERKWRLEDDGDLGGNEVMESIDMLGAKIDSLLD